MTCRPGFGSAAFSLVEYGAEVAADEDDGDMGDWLSVDGADGV